MLRRAVVQEWDTFKTFKTFNRCAPFKPLEFAREPSEVSCPQTGLCHNPRSRGVVISSRARDLAFSATYKTRFSPLRVEMTIARQSGHGEMISRANSDGLNGLNSLNGLNGS